MSERVDEILGWIAVGLLPATFVGLGIARKIRERRDAERSEAMGGGWRVRSQVPCPAPDPYARFGMEWEMILDTREGSDQGFEVAYFDAYPRARGCREHCAIVDLPVEGPTLDSRTPVSGRRDIGAHTSDALASMTDMVVRSVPFAILVHGDQPSEDVQRAALRLAQAIVADAKFRGERVELTRPGSPRTWLR